LPGKQTAVTGADGLALFRTFDLLGDRKPPTQALLVTDITREGFRFDAEDSVLSKRLKFDTAGN
ncbi:MAG: hypothetical protein ACE5JX_15455, partial [Acidobacteriota bacterium]